MLPIASVKVGVDRKLAALRRAGGHVRCFRKRALATLAELGNATSSRSDLPTPEEMSEIDVPHFLVRVGRRDTSRGCASDLEEYGGGARGALLIPAVDYLKALNANAVRVAGPGGGSDEGRSTCSSSPTYPIAYVARIAGLPIDRRHDASTTMEVLRFTMPYDLLGLPAISIPGGVRRKTTRPLVFKSPGGRFKRLACCARPMPTSKRHSGTCDILISNLEN